MARPSFKPSVWHLDDAANTVAADEQIEVLGDILFVPVAKDGTFFSPECKRSSGYQLGPKGLERTYDDYVEALEALNAMEVPRWRRPNARGYWGTVTAISWTRKTRAELGL